MDMLARVLVLQELDFMQSTGRFHWAQLCHSIHNSLLTANGPLRPVFEPHRRTFVLLIHSIAIGIQISNSGIGLPMDDHDDFETWISDMMDRLGEVLLRELLHEMDHGLHVAPLHPRTAVPLGYQRQPHMNINIVLTIMDSFKERKKATAKRAVLHRLAAKLWLRCRPRWLSSMSSRRIR
ncbi:hypothetical protein CC86DRAFT_64133 [Ophiobolus disseminans]|uniref:Uncharacterized protein n=1 Tax=Ophiobolus disseminans TaxID=1469910 RepID=A0A6A6ZRV2_9PLEO|nr:hypothetical protein CC86DRAFT_64133 [Ophiobolus disseminans]